MSCLRALLLLALFVPTFALGECPAAKREVTSLPGYGQPPSKWWSGFIDAELLPGKETFGHMCFHYTYVESHSNPANDPVLIWYQGGPGAPGLFGLLVEFGPLLLNADSLLGSYKMTGMPQPVLNPFSWARRANLLIMDNTPPVGFSFCTAAGPSASESQCGEWTDTSTFSANHKALTIFFNSVMPELLGREVFFAAESYGGVYGPGISSLIIDDPQGINLKGFAIGNGCMGLDVLCTSNAATPPIYRGPWYDVLFFHGHGQVSNELYARILATCPMDELKGEVRPVSAPCQAVLDEMFAGLGGFWAYDILDDCDWSWVSNGGEASIKHRRVRYPFHPNGYACSSEAHEIWLEKKEVRAALGVPTNSRYILIDDAAGFTYTSDERDVRPMWLKGLKAGLRILAYAGDLDTNVNMFALEDIFVDMWRSAGYSQTQAWRPWTLDGAEHMGGYAIEWAGGNASFLTFRGSGHMVPEYKSEASAVIMEHWLAGKDWPHYEAGQIEHAGLGQKVVTLIM